MISSFPLKCNFYTFSAPRATPWKHPQRLWSSGDILHLLNGVWRSPLMARFDCFQCAIAEMCGDPESFSCYKEIDIRWTECWGSRHPSAHRKCGDDWGQDEAGPQDHDKGNHRTQTAQLLSVLVTICKCILEMLDRVEVTVIGHDVVPAKVFGRV